MDTNASRSRRKRAIAMLPGLCACLVLAASAQEPQPAPASAQAQVPAKKPVATQADLPTFTYPIDGTATALMTSDDATFNAFAGKVGADVDRVLDGYDIKDAATLRGYLHTRADVQMLLGQDAAALATIDRIRALEDKPDRKLMTRLSDEALLRTRLAAPGASIEALRAAYAAQYAALLAPMPWDVVGARVLRDRRGMVFMTRDVTLGSIAAYVEPGVAKTHQLSGQTAAELMRERVSLRVSQPLKAEGMRAMGDYIASHRVETPDIWRARDIDLAGRTGLTPVNVAIWDEGIDLDLFPGRVFTDPAPDPRRDPHGIAFDKDFQPAHGPLIPLTDAQRQAYPEQIRLFKGSTDMALGRESPEVDLFVQAIEGMKADQVPVLMEQMGFFGSFYVHGTHVAGIAAAGNPAIRLAYGRQNWDWRNVPAPPTDENVGRMSANFQAFVDWFRSRGMRVVNMSWGGDAAGFEQGLEANGIGKDSDERKAIARRYFQQARDALYRAIQGAPEVLFVAAAGNASSDAGFSEDMPASFDLPNLLVVGAVDKSGKEASFTSYGKTVKVHANGRDVESTIPGGQVLPMSGTSMAAPQVVNLAAKLLAIDPSLQPAQVIELIEAGAERSADGRRNLINPKRSVELLSARTRPGG